MIIFRKNFYVNLSILIYRFEVYIYIYIDKSDAVSIEKLIFII